MGEDFKMTGYDTVRVCSERDGIGVSISFSLSEFLSWLTVIGSPLMCGIVSTPGKDGEPVIKSWADSECKYVLIDERPVRDELTDYFDCRLLWDGTVERESKVVVTAFRDMLRDIERDVTAALERSAETTEN